MVAGYVNGRWPTFPSLLQRFPHAVHVSIAVNTSVEAMVLDVETGDATPDQAPAWCQRQRQRGGDPTVYCNSSTWPAVEASFRAAGVPLPHWWEARYDNKAVLDSGAVAKQYRSDITPPLDYSVVADYWPGVDHQPPPTTQEDPKMTVFDGAHASDDDRDGAVRVIYLGVYGSPPTPAQMNYCKWLLGSGVPYGALARGIEDSAKGAAARAARSPQTPN